MKPTVLFAAILSAANALPALTPVSEENSFLSLLDESLGNAKRDDVSAVYQENCYKWRNTNVRKVPTVCLKELFCDGDKQKDNTEECGFKGQLRFPKDQIDKMSDKCVEQAVCNVIRAKPARPQQAAQEAEKTEPKAEEKVRDIEIPGDYRVFRQKDYFGLKCTEYLEEDWNTSVPECMYNILCTQPVPENEPKCTTLDPAKKQYSFEDFTKLTQGCAREVLCHRAKGGLNYGSTAV